MNPIRRVGVRSWVATALAIHAMLSAPVALGQTGKLPAGKGAKPREVAGQPAPLEFEIVRLRYVIAADTAKLLQDTFDDDRTMRLIPDERTNSLLIRAPAAKFAEIAQVLKKLDVPGAQASPEPSPSKPSMIELHSLVPDAAVQQALQIVVAPAGGLFSVDTERRMVILNASPVTTDSVRELLKRLETVGKSQTAQEAQVRITWLYDLPSPRTGGDAEGGAGPPGKASALPDDLKEVLPGLARLGLERPRVAAQLMVNTQAKVKFQAKGTPLLPKTTGYSLSASGQLSDLTPAGLEISIGVTAAGAGPPVCSLQTQINAPSGHLVVLGVTPIQGINSAFVVQVIRKGEKERRQ